MHIAIVTTEFVTEKNFGGGLANFSANLARILNQHGHHVTVFVSSFEDSCILWEEDIEVYRVPYELYNKKLRNIKDRHIRRLVVGLYNLLGKSYLVNKKIKMIDKKRKIDVVHFCSSEAMILFRSRKIPAIVRISTYQPLMRLAQEKEFKYYDCIDNVNYIEYLQLFSMKRADYIFGPSHNVAKLTERKINRKVHVIESPFNIDIESLDYSIYNDKLQDQKYIVFYGTLGYLKGVHLIAEILEHYFKRYPECYFVFIGNTQKMVWNKEQIDASEYIYKLAKEYSKNIIYFPAMKNKKQLYALIEKAWACILPSRFDNLPNTCIEAMALGQIVIGTNGASFEQLIEEGVNGFLIERDNVDDLYKKIVRVMELNVDQRAEMSMKAKKTVERLRPEKIYCQLIEMYRKVAEKKNSD